MTIDEAIKHCLEVAEQKERDSVELIDILDEQDVTACKECAADHRQLAEWLTELKEWKENPFLQIKTECRKNYYCNNCTFINHCPFAKWLTELREAKRLLKAAVEDINAAEACDTCEYYPVINSDMCQKDDCYKWRYADEAEKLIGGSENENNK